MSDSAKDAYDKGFSDGLKERPNVLAELLTGTNYKGHKDYPRSYKKGFKEGRKQR